MLEYQIWLIFAGICLILELVTMGFFFMSFGVSAAICSILAYFFNIDPVYNFIIFIVLSIVFLILSRPFANYMHRGVSEKLAASDRLIGEETVLLEGISGKESGFVSIHGDEWNVTSNQDIARGERVKVVKIDGVKLVVEKV